MNKMNVLAFSGTNESPNKLPLPKISLTDPKMVKAIVNPNPIPIASIIEESKLFFDANASALPKIIQLTTINGMNIPNCSYKKGTNASKIISTIVTNDAIMMIKAGILTFAGITPFTKDTTTFDMSSTKAVAIPIPKQLNADEVTPRVGHIPKSITNVGFSFIIPFKKFCLWFNVSAIILNVSILLTNYYYL